MKKLIKKQMVIRQNLNVLNSFLSNITSTKIDYKVDDDYFTIKYRDKFKRFKAPEVDSQYEIIECLHEVTSFIDCKLFLNLKDYHHKNLINIYDDYNLLHKIQESSLDRINLPYLINDDNYFLSDWWSYDSSDFFELVKAQYPNLDIVSYKGKDFYIIPEAKKLHFLYLNYNDEMDFLGNDIYIAYYGFDYKDDIEKVKDMLLQECIDLNVRGLINKVKRELIFIDKVDDSYAIEEDFEYELDKALACEDLSDPYNVFNIKDDLPRLLKGFCDEINKNVFKYKGIALLNLKTCII